MFTQDQKNIIQPKLTIGQPNDKYEQEADAVADQVMRMPASEIPSVQRKCDKCEEEELQMKPQERSISTIQQKSKGENKQMQGLQSSLQQSKGGGKALDASTNQLMSRGIGADFSNVKIHTDSNAIQMNQQLNAKAFTNGSDIYFNQGQYNTQSSEGKHLLAHELTHVVQQRSATDNTIQRYSDPDLWCSAFMDLIRYEDNNSKLDVLMHYHSLSNERLIPLNHNIPSIYGEVDMDWMLRLAFVQYPFVFLSIFTPSMAEGFGSIASRLAQLVLKTGWNTIRAVVPEYDLEYSSVIEEGNWNSSPAIVAYVHHPDSLRDIFAPAVEICENL